VMRSSRTVSYFISVALDCRAKPEHTFSSVMVRTLPSVGN
jgi:hypothetical protein